MLARAAPRLRLVLTGVCACLLVLSVVEASDPPLPDALQLEDVIRIAVRNRAELSAATARADALSERPAIVGALEDPMISPSIDHYPFDMPREEEGMEESGGGQPDLSRVWVIAEVAEGEAAQLRIGAAATLRFPMAQLGPFAARVEFVYPTLTERTRTVRVRLPVENKTGVLRPGMYGSAEFKVAAREALTVARDAVVDTGSSQHVFVHTANNVIEPRIVKIGARLADRIEVIEGLSWFRSPNCRTSARSLARNRMSQSCRSWEDTRALSALSDQVRHCRHNGGATERVRETGDTFGFHKFLPTDHLELSSPGQCAPRILYA